MIKLIIENFKYDCFNQAELKKMNSNYIKIVKGE